MGSLFLVAAIVALILVAVGVLRMPVPLVALGMVLAGLVFGYAFVFNVQIGSSNFTIDRLLLPVLVASYLVQRRLGRTDPKPMEAVDWILLSLLGWLVLSMVTHDYNVHLPAEQANDLPGDAFRPSHSTSTIAFRMVTAYLIPAMLFWVARQSHVTRSTSRAARAVLVLFGVYLAVTGIFEVTQHKSLVFPHFIVDPKLGLHMGRARGPMLNAVPYGLDLGISFLYLGTSFLVFRSVRDRWQALPRTLITLLLTPLFVAGIYVSYTRSVWMGMGLGLTIALALTTAGRTRILTLATVLILAGGVTAAKWSDLMGFKRGVQSAAIVRESANDRLSFTYVSWKMFGDSPIWGHGFGQFPTAKLPYLNDRQANLPLYLIRPLVHHNTFLSLLVETGIIGFGLFLALLGAFAHVAWRLHHAPDTPHWAKQQAVLLMAMLGLYACQLAFHEVSFLAHQNSLVFLLAGLTAGIRVGGVQPAAATQAAGTLPPVLAVFQSPVALQPALAVPPALAALQNVSASPAGDERRAVSREP